MPNQEQKPKKIKEILVVDDELTDLELMCKALRTAGHKAFPASGYRAGINTFQMHKGKFDLLVTAVSLPEANGCELAKNILAMLPGLSVLFVSRTSGAEVCRFYEMLGPGVHFLEKPFDADKFVRLVRLILEPCVPFCAAEAG
jgi:two-component system, cell cycle sensor histidine kinase and response regulator CckA